MTRHQGIQPAGGRARIQTLLFRQIWGKEGSQEGLPPALPTSPGEGSGTPSAVVICRHSCTGWLYVVTKRCPAPPSPLPSGCAPPGPCPGAHTQSSRDHLMAKPRGGSLGLSRPLPRTHCSWAPEWPSSQAPLPRCLLGLSVGSSPQPPTLPNPITSVPISWPPQCVPAHAQPWHSS